MAGLAGVLALGYVLFFRPFTAEEIVNALYMAAFLLGAGTVFPSLLDVGESAAAFTKVRSRVEIGETVVNRRQARDRVMTVTFALAAAALSLAGCAFLISRIFL
jgi:hypothetical protein